MDNIDCFNRVVTAILGDLYANFPRPIHMDMGKLKALAKIPDQDWSKAGARTKANLGQSTLQWLRKETFIDYADESETLFASVVLTSKGLTALNKPPDSLTPKSTIGELMKALSNATSSAATTETIRGLVRLAFDQVA